MKNQFHRRDVLRMGSAGLFAGGLSALFGSANPAFGLPAASFLPGNPNRKMLIIWQRGGNDGVNTLVPFGDSQYATLRPNLALGAGQTLSLTGSAGGNGFARLHGSMAKIMPFYDAPNSKVALCHQIGYPMHSRSHFESQQNIETTRHFVPGFIDGIVPRMQAVMDPTIACPLFGISVSNQMQTTFNGAPSQPVIPSIASYGIDPSGTPPTPSYAKLLGTPPSGGGIGSGIHGAYSRTPTAAHAWDATVRARGLALIEGLNVIAGLGPYTPFTNWTTYPYPVTPQQANAEGLPANGITFGFFSQLRDAVQLLKQTCSQVVGVQIGAWDTHADQLSEQAGLLHTLAHGLRTVMEDAQDGLWSDLAIFVVTEFGRTSQENQSGGTDHGNGFVSIVAGGNVNGGVYNCNDADGTWIPGSSGTLFAGQGGVGVNFIQHLTDYRTLLVEILDKHFGITGPTDIDFIVDDYSNQVGSVPYLGVL